MALHAGAHLSGEATFIKYPGWREEEMVRFVQLDFLGMAEVISHRICKLLGRNLSLFLFQIYQWMSLNRIEALFCRAGNLVVSSPPWIINQGFALVRFAWSWGTERAIDLVEGRFFFFLVGQWGRELGFWTIPHGKLAKRNETPYPSLGPLFKDFGGPPGLHTGFELRYPYAQALIDGKPNYVGSIVNDDLEKGVRVAS